MGLFPGPVRDRRIQSPEVVEKDGWGHMKLDVPVGDYPGLSHGQESRGG